MAGFKGSYKHTIDQKGRINIPAKFRRAPGTPEGYVITRGLNGCLYVFPVDEWDKVELRLRSLKQTDPDALYYLRETLSNAADAQVDKQGRINIPSNLTRLAGLGKEVLIIGALERMEIWAPDNFEKYLKECPGTYEEVAKKVFF